MVDRVARRVPSDDLQPVDRYCLTVTDDPELVFRDTGGRSPEGLHHVSIESFGRRQEFGGRILEMRRTKRVAENLAAGSLREYARAPGVVEVDVGREHRP
jgi:hypothetical protein